MTIGRPTHSLVPGPISAGMLTTFADASGDHNPIHLDTQAARSVGWDDVIAHGMLSMAYLGRLLTDSCAQAAIRSFRVRFIAITPLYAEPVFTAHEAGTESGRTVVVVSATLPDGTTTLAGTAVIAPDGITPSTESAWHDPSAIPPGYCLGAN